MQVIPVEKRIVPEDHVLSGFARVRFDPQAVPTQSGLGVDAVGELYTRRGDVFYAPHVPGTRVHEIV
ncbi:MAG: hypothetical protein KDJ26_06070 [Alphaproteobacteria bacterium]|nr:hypothetical protein [Alphaproteobacteria bacterium]MCB1551551.1 hypothetical protein [Alphaproteobacteria bacterium]MCB9985090.1 hypothetical protein [Micavibrio sp.]HRK97472.1 hypothetical protein [Alphaproteobacteria bacterium]